MTRELTHAAMRGGPRGVTGLQLLSRRFAFTEMRFSSWTIGICMVLQRFALPSGDLRISVAAPLVFALAIWGFLNGSLVLEKRRLGFYAGLCAAGAMATAVQFNIPLAIAPRQSLSSLEYWLGITALATLQFRQPVNETRFMRMVDGWFAIIAICGILQFIAQFAGLSLFSFSKYFPSHFLIEDQYAVVIPMEGSGIIRSNGFFLVEPSVFSQFMAIGLIIEWLYFQRVTRLLLFLAAMVVSFSGTGWIVLGVFVIEVAITAGGRGLLQAIIATGATAGALAIASFASPEISDAFVSRIYEFTLPGTSGNERFVTPFMAMGAVLHDAWWTFLTGIGPGAAEQLTVPYVYRLNTPVKIIMEYGVFGLIFYIGLLFTAIRTRRQTLILLPLMVLLMFTGGYQQFPPILFCVVLLSTIAWMAEEAPVAAPASEPESPAQENTRYARNGSRHAS